MAKISNRRKETLAVNAIERETLRNGSYLVADIPVGDKAPSFDGQITVYKDDSEKKESYINDVPTQVKGTGVKTFTKVTRKFPLDLIHFQNYYKRGGCLLLVVEILENTETKIFFKQLLPTELKQIISTWGHQKTASVELRPLDETTLYIVCRRFIDQMIKQPQILIEKNQYKEEDYEKLIFTSMTFDLVKSGVKDIFNHDFIQFGLKDNIEYPIRNLRIGSIGIEQQENININGKEFDVTIMTNYSPPIITKIIEDCLEFTFYENKDKLNFKINEVKSLAAQLKILPLLIEFLKTGKIRFDDYYGTIKIDEGKPYLNDLEEAYSLFLKLQKVFQELNVDENVQFGNKNNIHKDIEKIVEIMINKNYRIVNFADPGTPRFIKYTIGDIYLILFYNPSSETKLINAFSKEILDMPTRLVFNDTKEAIHVSPYFMLEKETLVQAKNIDFDVMIQSFESLDYEKSDLLFSVVNNFCLVCLNAFDETKNKEMLRLPTFLLSKLKEKISDKQIKSILAINLLQSKYRQYSELSQEDYKELITLKEYVSSSLTDSLELRFCINVLLQSKKEAEILFEDFDDEKKQFYETLPIFLLYKNLK
ncbi:hypothetical protein ABLO26_25580 [Neobacillus sp. 179-J 1A1 HS]|uniref:hypothetical protein n=1 Tax=Neobacillus driksii TaxID=3035913 RepID=UPI0035BC703F